MLLPMLERQIKEYRIRNMIVASRRIFQVRDLITFEYNSSGLDEIIDDFWNEALDYYYNQLPPMFQNPNTLFSQFFDTGYRWIGFQYIRSKNEISFKSSQQNMVKDLDTTLENDLPSCKTALEENLVPTSINIRTVARRAHCVTCKSII
jgi:hypothetical protein